MESHTPTPPFRPKPLTYIQPFRIFIYLGNEIVPELSRASDSARYHYHLSFYAKEDKKNLPKSRKLISPLGQTKLDIHVLDLHNQNRRKVMHFEQENDLKAHFGPIFDPDWPFLDQAKFSQHFDRYQGLDIVILNQNMQNRPKLMHFEQCIPNFHTFGFVSLRSIQSAAYEYGYE